MNERISIIVPVYNEEKVMGELLDRLEPLLDECEVLIVDGQSTDRTRSLVRPPFTLVTAAKGRAAQMNQGALASTGNVLLFLHADSLLPPDAISQMRDVLERHQAGCFGIRFPRGNFFMLTCSFMSNLRARVRGIAFGDQGIFLQRDLFFDLGMFPEIPLMEDYQLSLILRQRGVRFGLTRDRILTSDRRFPPGTLPKLQLMWQMHVLRARYRLGADPVDLLARYTDIR